MSDAVSDEATVLVSNQGAVRTLTLNRPAALNSLTAAMHAELLPALEAAAGDAGVRAVVITGAGRGFCAGQDLRDPAMVGSVDVGAVVERHYRPLATRVRSMPVPAPTWRCAATSSSPRAAPASSRPSARSASSPIAAAPGCCRAWWVARVRWAWR